MEATVEPFTLVPNEVPGARARKIRAAAEELVASPMAEARAVGRLRRRTGHGRRPPGPAEDDRGD